MPMSLANANATNATSSLSGSLESYKRVEYLELPRIVSSLVYSTSYLDLPDSLPLIHPFSSLTTSSQSTTSFQ